MDKLTAQTCVSPEEVYALPLSAQGSAFVGAALPRPSGQLVTNGVDGDIVQGAHGILLPAWARVGGKSCF